MSDKRKELDKLLTKLKEKQPDLNIGFNNVIVPESIPTPFVTLNNLNGGGLPRGCIGVIAGPSQSAKTTLMAQTIGYNHQQDPNFVALWDDFERSFDKPWNELQGIDLDRLIIQAPGEENANMETMLDASLALIKSKGIDLWVIDSIGAMLVKADETKDLRDNENMLALQKKMGSFLRKAINAIAPTPTWKGCAMVMIGQVYNVPTTTGVGLEEVRGGNSVKHFAHWRWKTRRGNKDEGPDPVDVRFPDGRIGKIVPGWAQHIKMDKSKINANESQEIILQFVHGRGLDSTNAAITALIANEVIQRDGAMYRHEKLPDGKIRGRDALIKFLQDNKAVREELIKEMDQLLAQRQVDLGEESGTAEAVHI
jgi:RecA/RadA recombinase